MGPFKKAVVIKENIYRPRIRMISKVNYQGYKIFFKTLFAVATLVMLAIFFIHERHEIKVSIDLLTTLNLWIIIGLSLSFIYIYLQGYLYVSSFRALGIKVDLQGAVGLYLKRNLLSIILPAGGFTSLAFFSDELKVDKLSREKINMGSIIYAVAGIASLLLLAIPVIIWYHFVGQATSTFWKSVSWMSLSTALIGILTWSFLRRGAVFNILYRFFPSVENLLSQIDLLKASKVNWWRPLFTALLTEIVGIAHVYIAMLALGIEPNLSICIWAYTIATLLYCFSPVLKGIGTVEISMVMVFMGAGIKESQAISITLLYRAFEFWLPLIASIFPFIFKKMAFWARLLPALFVLILGLVNIISVMSPALTERIEVLDRFIPLITVDLSNGMVLLLGVLLTISTYYLFLGVKSAWYMAFIMVALSFFGNLTKGFDYEESLLALIVMIFLLISYPYYDVKSNINLKNSKLAIWTSIFLAIICYGTLGFYFLQGRHIDGEFTLATALTNSIKHFLLLNNENIQPWSILGTSFLSSLNILGIIFLVLLVYRWLKPQTPSLERLAKNTREAKNIVNRHGLSPVDYFKLSDDKHYYFCKQVEGFFAFGISSGYAIVLEGPVCEKQPDNIRKAIVEFENFCKTKGIRPAYYQVNPSLQAVLVEMGKKSFHIGQEALIDIGKFTLEGKKRKALRNTVNKLKREGYEPKIYHAPISDAILDELKTISDNWLATTGRRERGFSQGTFIASQLKLQDIIVLENAKGKIVAFLNVIPDYVPGETTYDLIRKLTPEEGGNIDILILKFIEYCREQGYSHLNMGLAPFSGALRTNNLKGKLMELLRKNAPQIRAWQGLREFKDKFDPLWEDRFLVYENACDLILLPKAIKKVMEVPADRHPY
ncbi:lysylphosphatidylglycerol synthetase family protein [Pedobacter riviphilus]|uniref:Phosphatidylglycerol lysyltransferase n=1 Tax=Pedobacter riviphilus TaxID=2766984 RepID=A0ABX6TPS2_9SPHI|nr:phosphatidylglycerol lysyltransferase domain-containing protein [Pedobacter riviphilus]QNR86817.1 lysylphosphatidylglycerol synthetase family protein [Pedobacter riviphilus]